VHVKKVKLAPDADLEKVAALTPGFTGADLANLVNEATLVATRRGADAVSLADFTAAGRADRRGPREEAAHPESQGARDRRAPRDGHALVAFALPGTDPVHKISIIPRGIGALGYTIQRPTEDRF
jgi:cell division protease FtsH